MNFKFTKEEEDFRGEVRSFVKGIMENELNEWTGTPDGRPSNKKDWRLYRIYKQLLGEKGWLCINWPKKYGGLERQLVDQAIINEETAYLEAPFIGQEATYIGATIMTFGTDEQKSEYCLKIAKGLINTCQGFSEPDAGSDLASLKTKAVDKGDHFIIQGEKVFTSWANEADYCLLVARTDPELAKHKGLSLFFVDMKTPGISVHPYMCLPGIEFLTQTFWDNVTVPLKSLVGGVKNQGWGQITTCLNFERSMGGELGGGVVAVGQHRRQLDDLIKYAKECKIDGKVLADDPLFQRKVAELSVEFEVSRLFAYNVLHKRMKGESFAFEASAAKLFGSEFKQRMADVCLQFLGPFGQLQKGTKWAPLDGVKEYHYRVARTATIGGGTSEIQRYLIATRDCGLPRS